jgi:hypothetical protein
MMAAVSDAHLLVNLRDEAHLLHQQFFGRTATTDFVNLYLKAHAEIPDLLDASVAERRTVRLVFAKRLDACGLEPWLRAGTRRHLLSRKLMLVAYLAECDGAHPEFRRAEVGRLRSWVTLSSCGLKGIFRLLRGRWQKARYGLL